MQRYFAKIINNQVQLSNEDMHHLNHVMRMRVGDFFEVVDNKTLYICEITSMSPFAVKMEKKEENVELNNRVTLFFALAKGDKIDLVIQKATELGTHRVVLFKSHRCVVNFDNKDVNKKIDRYQKIAKEASEQCHRLMIPEIVGVVDIKNLKDYKEDLNFIAYEKVAGDTSSSLPVAKDKSVSIVIGPEGGFEQEEVDNLVKDGFIVTSLGKRILRCETAAIYALSVIAYQLEK